MPWISGEQPLQIAIVGFRRIEGVESQLLPVVFGERVGQLAERFDPFSPGEQRSLIGDFGHQIVNEFKFLQYRPAGVAHTPVRAGPEPDRKRFGEILVRVALCVPESQMLNEIPAGGVRPVISRIAFR